MKPVLIRHAVPPDALSQRLDRYLTTIVPDSSRAQIQKWIGRGLVRIAGKLVKASHRIRPGEKVSVEIPPPALLELKPEPIPLEIVYEDKHLLVVDKPSGLVVHPAPGHASGTLVNALLARGGSLSSMAGSFKPGIVHRLDKETSGLLLVAKDDPTHRQLSRQFADRKVEKVYLAIVQGAVERDEGTIDAPIGRHPIHRQQMVVRPDARRQACLPHRGPRSRQAQTRYRVLERFKGATLLELFPKTGRTHQLRVHLKYLGHPVLGDARYGVRGRFPRMALHAHRLGFTHPQRRRWMEFISPFPKDLRKFLLDNPKPM